MEVHLFDEPAASLDSLASAGIGTPCTDAAVAGESGGGMRRSPDRLL